jgi:Mg/Co/Ni transporter MgtE
MSSGLEEDVHSAVPVPDLSFLDHALRGNGEDLKHALKNVRPADLGRELSRRSVAEGTKLLHAIDDRHGAAMLRAAHPVAAASLLSGCEGERAARLLAFLPTEHEVAILSQVPADARARIERAYTAEQKRRSIASSHIPSPPWVD